MFIQNYINSVLSKYKLTISEVEKMTDYQLQEVVKNCNLKDLVKGSTSYY